MRQAGEHCAYSRPNRITLARQAIPAGQTASYAEIAERIGQPQAYRAVAHACAGNPVALAIPCYRAVRADGSLAGYRRGIARKAGIAAAGKRGMIFLLDPPLTKPALAPLFLGITHNK